MRLILILLSTAALLTGTASAQQAGPSPAETKLREMLKSTTQRMTAAETEAAALKAEKTTTEAKLKAMEAKIKDLEGKLDDSSKELSATRETAAKREAALTSNLKAAAESIVAHQKSLDKWKAAHIEISAIAKKKESERASHAAKASALERRVADLRTRNASLYATGLEILDRYKKFGLGEAITAREPFTGLTKVKLQNLVREFGDKLLDATADSKRPPPPAAVPAPPAESTPPAKPEAEPASAEKPAADAANPNYEPQPAAPPEKVEEDAPVKSN